MTSAPDIRILLFIAIVFLLTGCITVSEFDSVVRPKVEAEMVTKTTINTNYLILKTDKLLAQTSPVNIKKLSSFMVPLGFFWGWERSYSCDINSQYFSNIFAITLQQKARELELKKCLGNKKIEVTIEEVPKGFLYSNTGTVYFFMVVYFYDFNEVIYPQQQNFKITYRLMQGDNELKKDTFNYQFKEPVKNSVHMSVDFLDFYMQDLRTNFETKSSEFIERIIEEL